MSETPENEVIKVKLSEGLDALFSSLDDALIFAATTARTLHNPKLFFAAYEAATGEKANMRTLTQYDTPKRYREIIQTVLCSNGLTIAENLKKKAEKQ